MELRVLRRRGCGVSDEESQEREKGLPQERPMVVEARAGGDKVGEKLMNEGDAGYVQRDIEAAAEVVVQGVD